jgi:preprotein translocase subunit SecY
MIETLKNIWNVAELRAKLIFTFGFLAFYRIGAHIPAPFIDSAKLNESFEKMSLGGGGGAFGFVDMFTGGAFSQMTVMALGVMPYISASIIMQILTVVIPNLERLSKEGESGRRKINQITRYSATILAAFQSIGIGVFLLQQNVVVSFMADHRALFLLTTMIAMTTGCTILMWIGERITDKGVGNGVSILIAAGIMSRYMTDVAGGFTAVKQGSIAAIWLPLIGLMCVAGTIAIIYVQEGARKIPIQHAKRVVGRRVQQGQTNFLPLKVNTASVMPVIFASAILAFPTTLLSWVGNDGSGAGLGEWFATTSSHNLYNFLEFEKGSIYQLLKVINLHTVLYIILTIFFAFFYTAIVFNPAEIAENLKKVGAYIPGFRPGKQTADYIDQVLTRITLVGAVFLVTIALVPQVLTIAFSIPFGLAELTGGTGLIIVVGVILDTMKQVESQLLMRHYEGFRLRHQGGGGGQSRRWSTR